MRKSTITLRIGGRLRSQRSLLVACLVGVFGLSSPQALAQTEIDLKGEWAGIAVDKLDENVGTILVTLTVDDLKVAKKSGTLDFTGGYNCEMDTLYGTSKDGVIHMMIERSPLGEKCLRFGNGSLELKLVPKGSGFGLEFTLIREENNKLIESADPLEKQ